jgi:TM2 domain-containing membrane protein YozV
MGRFVAAFFSLIFPGLGQLFYGQWGMALAWFAGSLIFGPLLNIFSAGHILITAR